MVGILWLAQRAEATNRAVPLLVIGGLLTAIGFAVAAWAGWNNHSWTGWPLVTFLVGFVIAAVGLADVIAGALAFEFRTGPPLPPDEPDKSAAKPPTG